MTETCPVPTPAEHRYGEIQSRIERAMLETVQAALREATDQARWEVQAADLDMPPPSAGYFTAKLHQRLFCALCHADPDDFSGGRADIALAVIRNSQNTARRYWGAAIGDGP